MITINSEKLFRRAREVMPGGVNSPVRAWKSVGGEPLFIKRGKGSKIFDEDGNRFTDYVMSWGPLILGHADRKVSNEIIKTLKRGTTFGAPNILEVKLAELIKEAMPGVEMMRFVNSGTEAVMSAIRVARAHTGREKIIKFEGGYHGHADNLLAKSGSGIATLSIPGSKGVLRETVGDTLMGSYNDPESAEKIFAEYGGKIAAVIIEPVAGNMGVVPGEKSFLGGLRKLTEKYKTVLIFDEVISGFRVGWGGAQELYGINPDLTILGKIIGGGLPVGVYGGKKEIMNMVSPLGQVYQAGTLSGNPVAMAAGMATLEGIKRKRNAYRKLEDLSKELEEGLSKAAKNSKVPVQINRAGSMMTLFFTDRKVTDFSTAKKADTKKYARFFHGMLEAGFYFPPSQFESFFLSLSHTRDDINNTVKAASKVLEEITPQRLI